MGMDEYIPKYERKHGVFVNEMNTIIKALSIEDLGHKIALKSCEKCTEIEYDILDVNYPHFLKLKMVLKLSTPKAYFFGKDLPLFIEYDDCAFMVAPAVESIDDFNVAVKKALKKDA